MKKKKEIEDDFKVFGTAHIAILERLDNSDLKELVINTLKYAKDKTIRHFNSNIAEFLFGSFKTEIDDEIARLRNIREKRRNSGRNGGLAKGSKCYQMLSKTKKHDEKEEKTENFDFSLNYKIKNKEVNINKGNNTQEDISTEDNIPYIKSPKKERNINISSQKRVLLSASDEKKPSKEEIDFSKLMLYFNEKMKGQTIRPITTMTDVRKRAVLARLRKHGKDSIQNVIDKAAASDWLNGNNNRNWVADFNWIFQENRFVDILEGKYDNSVKKTSAKSGYVDPMIADGTRLRQDQMDYTKNIW